MNEMIECVKKINHWFGFGNNIDCVLGRNLSDADKNMLRRNFDIPLDEEIFFMRDTSFWNDKNQGLVMTERGLYVIADNDSPQDEIIIEWKEFDRVVYKELNFYFYKGDDYVAHLGCNFLLKSDNPETFRLNQVCEFLNEMTSFVDADINPIAEANEGRFDVAIEEAERQLTANPDSVECLFNLGRVIYLEQCKAEQIDEERVQRAINLFSKAKSLTDDTNSLEILNNNMAYCYELMGQNYNARTCYVMALEYAEDRDSVMKELRGQEEQLKNIWDNYTETYDYQERKFCMPVRDGDIGGCIVPGIDVFMMSNIPGAFKFPIGHPYPNQLYIGHPYKKELYVPYEESEDMFFMDKVNEMCYLLECLGAESIEITSIQGKNVSEMKASSSHLSGSADLKLFSGEAEMDNKSRNSQDFSQRTARSYTIKLDPMKAPYLPDGLIWYPEQPQWQRLVERRLNNNILEYSENVQSSETRFTSSSEVNEIKGQAEYLWTKVGGSAKQNVDTQFKSSVDTVWSVSVKFRSLKDFGSQNTGNAPASSLSAKEQEYLDEVKFCLEEDGVITAKEERMLDRLRQRLGLSEKRAAEIREMAAPSLTEDEKEYLNEVKECLAYDGEISPKEERLLDRLRQRLGISEERAAQLRAMAEK
ncbi:MAG: hypothetical protein HDR38_05645 [Treponema sp.]|nr:hypothetical protein [Treponema sp.]